MSVSIKAEVVLKAAEYLKGCNGGGAYGAFPRYMVFPEGDYELLDKPSPALKCDYCDGEHDWRRDPCLPADLRYARDQREREEVKDFSPYFKCSMCSVMFRLVGKERVPHQTGYGGWLCGECWPALGPNLKTEGAIKNDEGKARLDLLSTAWITGVGEVLAFGCRKYAAHNWRLGLQQSRLLGAALRHIFAHLAGEDRDRESGLLHLGHASCCIMFAFEMHQTRPDMDDRYKPVGDKK